MCTQREERVTKIREAYEKGDPQTRLKLESKYGKDQLMKYVQESRTMEWVNNNSKPCPSCRIGTQKTKGCNKMWCARCGCHWCWLCNTKLRASNPYSHFSNTRTACYQKLFDGMSQAELLAQFHGFEEEEEPLMRHERPNRDQPLGDAPIDDVVDGRGPPMVEVVHINPLNLGLFDHVDDNLGPEGGRGEGEAVDQLTPGEADLMALQLEQQLFLDDDFHMQMHDDGLVYAQLQPQQENV